jgi:hypothetical protein
MRATGLNMKFRYALAASALALGVAVSAAPASASTVTDNVSFSVVGFYATNGDPAPGYQGSASGGFVITFDPTQLYPSQSIAGVISGINYSVTDPYWSLSPLSDLNPIKYFGYNNGGTLTLSSVSTLTKTMVGANDITITINAFTNNYPNPTAAVWFSQTNYPDPIPSFPDTLTASGGPDSATVASATPLPAALPLFASGMGGFGFLAWRRKRRMARLAVA